MKTVWRAFKDDRPHLTNNWVRLVCLVMTHVNIHEAKARFSALARKVKSGETIILCERNRPIAEIRPLRPGGKPGERRLGLMPGSVRMDKEFFAEDAAITAEVERIKNGRRRGR